MSPRIIPYIFQPRKISYFTNWSGSDLFWWFKDRSHYPGWIDDQLNGTWQDVPLEWSDKYEFVETIYR
jgi:hypothetical protein